MNCSECQDMLADYALNSLEQHNHARVAAHLEQGCLACQHELDEMRASWAVLSSAIPAVEPPSEVKAALLERIDEDARLRNSATKFAFSEEPAPLQVDSDRAKPTKTWLSFLPYIAASLTGVCLGYSLVGEQGTESLLTRQYQARISAAEQTFGSSQLQLASLDLAGAVPSIHGHLLWDPVAEQLHVYAFELGVPDAGFVFRLWFVTENEQWIAVGDLIQQSEGVSSAVLNLPTDLKRSVRAVVTMEPIESPYNEYDQKGPVKLSGEFVP